MYACMYGGLHGGTPKSSSWDSRPHHSWHLPWPEHRLVRNQSMDEMGILWDFMGVHGISWDLMVMNRDLMGFKWIQSGCVFNPFSSPVR